MNRDEALAEIKSITEFLSAVMRLLQDIERCSLVLFRAGFREGIRQPIEEALSYLEKRRGMVAETERSERFSAALADAGLRGGQLQLKLSSFQYSYQQLYETGEKEHLEDCMDKASTLLQSLAGAIPGFGSLAQELLAFLMKELALKWTRRK